MIRKLCVLGFVAASACAMPVTMPVLNRTPAPAPAPVVNPQSATERFVRATEANGCEVNQMNSGAILARATLSVEDMARIMTELKADGRGDVAADGRSFRLTTGACA